MVVQMDYGYDEVAQTLPFGVSHACFFKIKVCLQDVILQ